MNPAEQPPSTQDGNVLGGAAVPQPGPPQLPPQMFTTAAQLLDLTDSGYPLTYTLGASCALKSYQTMSCANHRFQRYRKAHASAA